jgi:hypothetical protein
MSSSSSEYSRFASQHQSLLDQYSALVEFKQGVYNRLALHAMSGAMRGKSGAPTVGNPMRMSQIISHVSSLASSSGIDDQRTIKAIRQYLKSVAASARRTGKGKLSRRPRRMKSQSEKIIDEAISRRRAAIEGELAGIPPSVDKARAALAHEILGGDSNDDGPPDALSAFGLEEARARFKDSVKRRRQNLLSGEAIRASARGYDGCALARAWRRMGRLEAASRGSREAGAHRRFRYDCMCGAVPLPLWFARGTARSVYPKPALARRGTARGR